MSPFTLYDASPASCIKHHTLLLELLSARRRRSMHYASSSIVKPRCPSVVAVNSSSFGAAQCSVTYRLENLLRHAMHRASCIMHHQISARRWLAARSSTTARIDWQTHTTARSVASVGSGGRAALRVLRARGLRLLHRRGPSATPPRLVAARRRPTRSSVLRRSPAHG